MRFIDEAMILVKAGDGGSGSVSFRREKCVPRGGPDGGDGGRGGDIVILADNRISSLIDLRYRKHYDGERGGHGMGKNRHGKNGEDTTIRVPVGTLIKNAETEELLCDLVDNAQVLIPAVGGRGGKGNAHFVSSTNQAPKYSQSGEAGGEVNLKLELKLLADVGIIGFPNAGKSTLISRISAAKPKVADYPFTTLIPNLGVVEFGDFGGFVVADIPGLIEGAHEGRGLGSRFLKHIERTSVLIHMIDLSPDTGRDPLEDYAMVNRELRGFKEELSERPQVVALNKVDITEAREEVDGLLDFFNENKIKVFQVSAVTGEGVKDLVNYVGLEVEKVRSEQVTEKN